MSKKRLSIALRMILSSLYLPVRKLPFALLECASVASKIVYGVYVYALWFPVVWQKKCSTYWVNWRGFVLSASNLTKYVSSLRLTLYIPFSLNLDWLLELALCSNMPVKSLRWILNMNWSWWLLMGGTNERSDDLFLNIYSYIYSIYEVYIFILIRTVHL